MITKIKNGRILSDRVLEGHCLFIKDGKILRITEDDHPYDLEIDAQGDYVSPGFIDIHLHGGGGYDFMDGGPEPIEKAAGFHLLHGTTSLMPTTLACSAETLTQFLTDLKQAKQNTKANILGAHIEGPYIASEQAGAQNPKYIKPPLAAEYLPMLQAHGDVICRWSFAPELPGSEEFCKALLQYGISPSIAHSNAVYGEVKALYDLGCRWVTHLYSSMSTITRQDGYRRLGVVESAYLLEDMAVEIIADGKHLPPELLRLILKCKSKDKICLVTDAMRAAGTDATTSFLGRKSEEIACVIDDGVAKLPDRTSFAGSIATADRLIRTMVNEANVSVQDAVFMMTKNPAQAFHLSGKGQLKEGYDADIVLFDDQINIKRIIVGGQKYGNQNL